MHVNVSNLPKMQIFQGSRDVFVLKDIEKLSVKKGIVQQSVKEVLQVSLQSVGITVFRG